MKVMLINQMNNIEDIANMASICYGHEKAKNPVSLFKHLIKLGHTSTLEHMVFTFKIEGISRACLAQLTRHRHASYTVESQRYVKYENGIESVIPDHLDEEHQGMYIDCVDEVYSNYLSLLIAGVKPEDARMVLPNATATNLYMTINLRSLMNFFQLRLDKSAQWEIRELAEKMFSELDVDLQHILEEYI